MLEYTLDEAEELLRGNQKTAQTTLEKVDEDLDFLRYKNEYFHISLEFVLMTFQRSNNNNGGEYGSIA